MSRRFITSIRLLLSLLALSAQAQQTPNVPYSPSVQTDKKGHEWYIEQNGTLQRNSNSPTMIGTCMTLQFGNQQFYSQQPMTTPDGKELFMSAQQPINGLSITRRVTFMDRDGGLRYVDEFLNTTSRDITVTVELRHSFNNTAKSMLSNLGRLMKDSLEPAESGFIGLPGESDSKAPALLFTIRAPKSPLPLRLTVRNNYQISIFYTLNVPAGKSQTLVHGIAQVDVGAKNTPEEITKACLPFSMNRLTKGLSKTTLKAAANLGGKTGSFGLDNWFPAEFWGVAAGSSDQLAIGTDSMLKGKAAATGVSVVRASGQSSVAWDLLAAIAGPGHTGEPRGWLWLRDGQRWQGLLETPGLHFTLINGADLPLTRLDRLILTKSAEPITSPPHTLIELWNGERLAIKPEGNLPGSSPWGRLSVPWTDIAAMQSQDDEALGGMLFLQDGTRLRMMPQPGKATLQTVSLGAQDLDLSQIRHIISPMAARMTEEESEPAGSFVELTGDQRLVGRITTASLTLLTAAGPIKLAPSNLQMLHDISDDESTSGSRVFQAELWGGGHITGSLEEGRVRIEGRGFAWDVPVRHLLRLSNPVPVADNALMRRMGQLLQDLGDAQWKVREAASSALREMGPLARGSLQEALKTSTDAEITQRLEELLQSED
jgi:hypothetical protein